MATIPTQHTWAALEDVTAGSMNSNLRDGMNFHNSGRPLVAISQNTPVTTLQTGAYTVITFDVTTLDRDGGHSTADNSRYICRTAGWYQANAHVVFAINNVGGRYVRFSVNGAALNASVSGGATVTTGLYAPAASSKLMYLNVNDYVQVQGFQDSGGPLNTAAFPDLTSRLDMIWISQ